ncbi:toll/interleukin-1 receptor domain-containing protein [Chlorobaculum limnaeum]|uniref:toll/interleukin-1 receptor domain-containing protein n=1 Tax=Chlorobaculum limnaeum TaxID=274537 RepID=UPI001F2B100A|nr:toll/interleukin-1 receptor domain-containing protein [Chlorobaculum limnaeum]
MDLHKIEVFLDKNDMNLQSVDGKKDPQKVVAAIKKGIQGSDFMICIASDNSLNSKWVPFELGYAYAFDSVKIFALRHKSIIEANLPDYLRIDNIIRTRNDFFSFLKSLKGVDRFNNSLEDMNRYEDLLLPLAKILDRDNLPIPSFLNINISKS